MTRQPAAWMVAWIANLLVAGCSLWPGLATPVLHPVGYLRRAGASASDIVTRPSQATSGGLEIVFLFVALFVCPVCFVVGVPGSIIVLIRSRYKRA